MSGESSRASEKRKGSTYLQMACSYLLVFLLPVLVSSALIYYIFMEPVNEQAMQLTIDDARMAEEACERQVQQAVDFFGALLGNDRLGDSFEPSDFEQVRLLKIQLKALGVSTNNGASAFLYCRGDRFLYSSSTSYSLARFLASYPIEGVRDEAAFQAMLDPVRVTCARVLRVTGSRQGFFLLMHEAGNAKYLLYYIPQSAVEALLEGALTGNSGLAMVHESDSLYPLASVFNDA